MPPRLSVRRRGCDWRASSFVTICFFAVALVAFRVAAYRSSSFPASRAARAAASASSSDLLPVVIVCFNPAGYASRTRNVLEQQVRLAATAGVLPLTVELAYEDEPFRVTSSSNPHHLQLRWPRGVGPLWSKENLINAAVERLLPRDWRAVGFIDAEVAMDNPQWAVDALRMLTNGTADAVQPFGVLRHFGYDVESMASYLASHGMHGKGTTWGLTAGHQGMGWVWNRRAYDALGGVYERSWGARTRSSRARCTRTWP